MLLGPPDIARRLQYRHRPGWSVWYGRRTRQYWALACWVRPAGALLAADTPEALEAAIVTFETRNPKPRQRSHAVAE